MKSEDFIMLSIKLFLLIPVVLILFGISYYLFTKHRYNKNLSLIIDSKFLQGLFVPSKNPMEASQSDNDEIDIESVDFLETDFRISPVYIDIIKQMDEVEN